MTKLLVLVIYSILVISTYNLTNAFLGSEYAIGFRQKGDWTVTQSFRVKVIED